jgi:predicted homoserine dehydrogenase-like protein
MILVDTALKKRAADGNPIRVGMIGVGFIGRACATQLVNQVPGIALVAIANRTPSKAVDAWAVAGRPDAVETDTQDALEDAIRAGRPVVTSDATLLCNSGQIDVILELTGAISSAPRPPGRDRGRQAFRDDECRARRDTPGRSCARKPPRPPA